MFFGKDSEKQTNWRRHKLINDDHIRDENLKSNCESHLQIAVFYSPSLLLLLLLVFRAQVSKFAEKAAATLLLLTCILSFSDKFLVDLHMQNLIVVTRKFWVAICTNAMADFFADPFCKPFCRDRT